jgi:flotillin
MFGSDTLLYSVAGFIALFSLVLLSSLMASLYQKCGANQAMIISGAFAREHDLPYKIRVGGGAIVWPLIQQRSFLSLEVLTIEVKPETPIITNNGVPVSIEGMALIKVPADRAAIAIAAESLLGKPEGEVASMVAQIFVNHLRSVVSSMSLKELTQNCSSTAHRVEEVSRSDLAKIGLTVVSFTINSVKDTAGKVQIASEVF